MDRHVRSPEPLWQVMQVNRVGNTSELAKFEAALNAVRTRLGEASGDWRELEKRLTNTRPDKEFRGVIAAYLEVAVLGSLLLKYGRDVRLYPGTASGKRPDCQLDVGQTRASVEVTAKWSDADWRHRGVSGVFVAAGGIGHADGPARQIQKALYKKRHQVGHDPMTVLVVSAHTLYGCLDLSDQRQAQEIQDGLGAYAGHVGILYFNNPFELSGVVTAPCLSDGAGALNDVCAAVAVAIREHWLCSASLQRLSLTEREGRS